jgi:hypothetical protein
LRPKTYKDYSGLTRLHIVPALGHIKLRNLTPGAGQRVAHRVRWEYQAFLVQYEYATSNFLARSADIVNAGGRLKM